MSDDKKKSNWFKDNLFAVIVGGILIFVILALLLRGKLQGVNTQHVACLSKCASTHGKSITIRLLSAILLITAGITHIVTVAKCKKGVNDKAKKMAWLHYTLSIVLIMYGLYVGYQSRVAVSGTKICKSQCNINRQKRLLTKPQ